MLSRNQTGKVNTIFMHTVQPKLGLAEITNCELSFDSRQLVREHTVRFKAVSHLRRTIAFSFVSISLVLHQCSWNKEIRYVSLRYG